MSLAQWRMDTLRTKEPATVAWVEAMPEGSVFWDVGANIGIYGLLAAQRGIMTVAVEPLPANYAALCAAVIDQGLSETLFPVCAGLSNKNCGSVLEFKANVAGQSMGQGQQIGCIKFTLDTLVRGFGLPTPTHIKIDTDGSDWRVLCGALEALKKARSIIIETVLHTKDHENITALLESEGFEQSGRHVSPLYPNSPIGMDHWHRA